MKKLISTVVLVVLGAALAMAGEATNIAGKWTMSMQSPHGPVEGPLEVKQDGSSITGTYTTQIFGTMSFSGKVEGAKVAFVMEVNGGEMKVEFTGTIDGAKMSGTAAPHIPSWSAKRQ